MTETHPKSVTIEEVILAGRFIGEADISADLYHKAPGLSFSGLKQFAETPAHYQAYLKRVDDDDTAKRVGRGVHARCLEPELFDQRYVIIESRTTKAGREQAEAATQAGMEVLTATEYEKVMRISDAVWKDPEWNAFTRTGRPETSIFWRDQETGVLLKCRPDWLRDDGIIVDLKTFGDLNDRAIVNQIHRMKYHWQSGLYLDGVNQLQGRESQHFVHFFVMTDEPYLVRPVVLNDASLQKARHDYRPEIARFAECERTNHWPGYERPRTGVTELALPDWSW